MRATLNIPDELLSEVQKIAGVKSKTKAIITAMREFIKQKKRHHYSFIRYLYVSHCF